MEAEGQHDEHLKKKAKTVSDDNGEENGGSIAASVKHEHEHHQKSSPAPVNLAQPLVHPHCAHKPSDLISTKDGLKTVNLGNK